MKFVCGLSLLFRWTKQKYIRLIGTVLFNRYYLALRIAYFLQCCQYTYKIMLRHHKIMAILWLKSLISILHSWVFGEFLCKMYQFVHSLSYTASIFILVVICMERYFAIIHPITCKQILTPTRLRVSTSLCMLYSLDVLAYVHIPFLIYKYLYIYIES